MFGLPAHTELDLRFSLFRIPVRVTPWFWVVTILLAVGLNNFGVAELAVWVPCVFLSILAHEMGHGLTARMFGFWPSITLHSMYGLCDSQAERQTPWQRVAVICGGPAAGFLVFLLLLGTFEYAAPQLYDQLSAVGQRTVGYLMMINLWWTIFNLFPVLPLDGGQLTATIATMISPRSGLRWALIISLVVGGVMAVFLFSRGSYFMGFVFASFALNNYMELQSMYQVAKYTYDDSDEWWRR